MRTSLVAAAAVSAAATAPRNVLGGALASCCTGPKVTGWARDGYCSARPADGGAHIVCAYVSREFLDFTRSRGNDLETPRGPSFPGLVPGDAWCLCASRWREAYEAGVAPPVNLSATDATALRFVTLDMLLEHAHEAADGAAVDASGAVGDAQQGGTKE